MNGPEVTDAFLPTRREWFIALIPGVLFTVMVFPWGIFMLPLAAVGLAAARVEADSRWKAERAADQKRGWCRTCGQPLDAPAESAPEVTP